MTPDDHELIRLRAACKAAYELLTGPHPELNPDWQKVIALLKEALPEVERRFPILCDRQKFPDCPRDVPWSFVAPHEAQAKFNHGGQDLEKLAGRGGLDQLEMKCVVEGRHWNDLVGA